MKKLTPSRLWLLSFAAWVGVFSLLAACNVFAPFEGSGSDLDHMELGLKYLEEGNYDRAIEEYAQISDAQTRREKLCTTNISKAGFRISTLVKTLTSGSVSVLGDVARQLLLWSETKQVAADNAKTQCTEFSSNATPAQAKTGVLLRSLASLLHCTTLIAKVDARRGTDDASCDFQGPNGGTLSKDDISDPIGNVSVGNPGMCAVDVQTCLADIQAIDPAALGNSGFSDLAAVYNALPPALKNQASTAQQLRIAIRDTL